MRCPVCMLHNATTVGRFMAPAQAARMSGVCFHKRTEEVGKAMYMGYTYFQKSSAMDSIRGTALGLVGRGCRK